MRVVATARGFDGITLRDEGQEFDVPDNVFDKRPMRDKDGKPTGEFYPAPSWFKRVERKPAAKEEAKDLV